MTSKHTPGPWESGLNPKGGYSNSVVVRPAGEFPHGLWIADCGSDADEARIANARLISAAPDMFEALKLLNKWFEITGSSVKHRWERIPAEDRAAIVAATKAAIAKAEGRS